MVPTKSVNTRTMGVLFDSLPREDFSAHWDLRLDNWKDVEHLSLDFVLMAPLEVDASVIFIESRFKNRISWDMECALCQCPTIVKTNMAMELGTANRTKGIIQEVVADP